MISLPYSSVFGGDYTIQRFMLEESNKDGRVSLVLGFTNINDEDILEAVERLYRVVN